MAAVRVIAEREIEPPPLNSEPRMLSTTSKTQKER